jgi:hypothetical protein
MAAQVGHQRLVADADPEQEAAAGKFGDGLGGRRHSQRIARVDVGDAGGEGQALGARGEVGRMRERLAPDRLGNPQRSVAVLFDLARELRALDRGHPVVEEPHSIFADIHDPST